MSQGLSIIIVNYKSTSLVLDCLRTVFIGQPMPNMEIIVVDNNSGDDGKEIILRSFPATRWFQLTYNAGFSRANNVGIKNAVYDTVLLLNSDTLNENNAIEKCYQSFTESNYIACGVQLLNADRSPQISGNFVMKGALNYLLLLPFMGSVLRWVAFRINVKKTNIPEAVGTEEVDWVNGAYLMVKKSAIEKAGLMDEDFFLYCEEIEWCGRLRKQGPICIYGDLNVVHLQGMTANETFKSEGKGYSNIFNKKGKQIMVSTFLRIRKQFGLAWFFFHLFLYFLEIPILFFGIIITSMSSSKKLGFKDFVGFCKNLLTVVVLTPKMIRNEPYFYKVI